MKRFSQKSFALAVLSAFLVPNLASASIFTAAEISNKNEGDRFSASDFNNITDTLKNFYRDDNSTTGDLSDDRIGILDSTPDAGLTLDVEGQIGATGFCDENGENCSTALQLTSLVSGGGADDLGSHVATKNLDLATFLLTGNGGSNGISITNAGWVGIGSSTPATRLGVDGQISSTGICDQNGQNCTTPAQLAGLVSGGGVASAVLTDPNPAGNISSPSTGSVAFNTTSQVLEIFNGSSWGSVDSTLSETEVDDLVANNGYLTEIAENAITSAKILDGSVGAADLAETYLTTETDPTANALAKATLSCASGQIAQFDGANWVCADQVSGADDLGSHVAAQNLDLNNYQIQNATLLSLNDSSTAGTCDSSKMGAIIFVSENGSGQKDFLGCDGTSWRSLTGLVP